MERREDVNGVISGIERGLQYAGLIGQVPKLHDYLLGNSAFRNFLERVMPGRDPIPIVTQMVLKTIKEYDDEVLSTERTDFLAFLRQQQKSTGVPMSTRDLMNHLMNNLLAGSDTTGISLRAIFYYLLKDNQVYQTLQQEIDQAQEAGQLSPMITQVCIKEAMRMHPGVSYPLERVVPRGGAELCGTYLPEGTVVGVNAAVIHRNRDIFGHDADHFRPERWLEGSEEKIKEMDRNLLTFGAGTRTCIGKNISIMEVGKFVPQMLRQFNVEWASSEPEWQVTTYWFAKQTGLM
ncbi:hypothetical protein F66182_12201, partial [Fusarium sp. NRRL 66182]